MNPRSVFDLEHYGALNSAREAVLRPLLAELRRVLHIETALDVGCGSGYFSGLLREEGLRVTGLDGRPENAALAAERHPGIPFFTANIEDPSVTQHGPADVVLCFGLLYHLENPFQAIRNLCALCRKVLLVESMCVPGDSPVMELRDECTSEDQGLQHVAFYPSEVCLVKLLYRGGFANVYKFKKHPEHSAYQDSKEQKKSRTMLVASQCALDLAALEHAPEPAATQNPWATRWNAISAPFRRVRGLLAKPWPEKVATLRRRLS